MIDDKKIEDAAKIYMIDEFYDRDEAEWNYPITNEEKRNQCIIDFKAGAKWAINEFLKDLWHPNTEEPDKNKSDIITLGFDNDTYLQFKESILWNKESWRHSISRCQIIKWAYLSDILPKDIINNKFDKKKQRMVMRRKIGDIYKAKIDSYNSYYQHMRLLGEVDEALSLDEWEKKHRKWL